MKCRDISKASNISNMNMSSTIQQNTPHKKTKTKETNLWPAVGLCGPLFAWSFREVGHFYEYNLYNS